MSTIYQGKAAKDGNILNDLQKSSDPKVKRQVAEIFKMASSFKELFMKNSTLIHIDLSHNDFMEIELDIMNEGLKENHSILGLHMLGN